MTPLTPFLLTLWSAPVDSPEAELDTAPPLVEVAPAPARTALEVEADAATRRGPVVDAGRRLSLDDCVRLALEGNLQLQQVSSRVTEATAARKVARGQFGPTLALDASVQVWAEEIAISFPAPMIPGAPMEEPEALVVQDQVTATIRTTLVQPLTGLWGISEMYRVQKKAQNLATLEVQREREKVALDISTAYYGALEAERLAEVALASVDAIAANRERIEAFYAAGVMGRDQLLEADTRLAEAQSLFIRAKGRTRLERANLAFVMGLPVDADLAPQPVRRADLPRVDRDLDSIAGRAMGRRVEVLEATLRREQAKHARRAATSNMVPQLSALASYQRTEGQAFALANQFFVGLNLSWNIWEWGQKWYRVPEAKARERQAEIAEIQVGEAIRLELHRALIELEVSEQQLEATDVAVEHAAENLRIVQLRFDAAAASATEVLDAVARRTRAEAEQANAYYGHLKALASYRYGLGELLASHRMEEPR